MVGLEENIKIYTEEFIKDSEYFLVDIVRGSTNRMTKISVYVDADTSVEIGKCAEISRYVSGRLDEEMDFEDPYIIEVSSAGLDRPLTLKRQYVKNIGRKVEVVMITGEKEEGELKEVSDNSITLFTPKSKKNPEKELIIENKNIKSTKILISF